MTDFRKIHLFVNQKKQKVQTLGREIALRLISLNLQLVALPETIAFLQLETQDGVSPVTNYSDVDLAVVLGGDGTLLSAVSKFSPEKIPLMGINLGTLGFLSAISPRDVSEAFTSVFVNNEYDSIKLDMLQLQLVRRGKPFKKWFALNDFVVLRDPRQPINIIDIYLDDQYIDSLHGDGMAIATPTGSTAYSLSCGGPIIAPDVPCILLTPISTHSLHARPMVFPILSGLTLRIKTPHDEGILSVDGQKHLRLHCEDSLHITKSGLKTTLITLKKYDFFSVLREKLKFGNDNR